MSASNEKQLYFEVILDRLLIWQSQSSGKDESNNDLSILKVMKLLFFISAARTNSHKTNSLLDNPFNHFVAMPYGHVESDVYDLIKENKGKLDYFEIDNKNLTRLRSFPEIASLRLDCVIVDEIEESIGFLKNNYPSLILYTSRELVDLSHLWYSWQSNYNLALKSERFSKPIKAEEIKAELKIFNLYQFA
jgi:uncharacterized phage-associated protein